MLKKPEKITKFFKHSVIKIHKNNENGITDAEFINEEINSVAEFSDDTISESKNLQNFLKRSKYDTDNVEISQCIESEVSNLGPKKKMSTTDDMISDILQIGRDDSKLVKYKNEIPDGYRSISYSLNPAQKINIIQCTETDGYH